jgi:hypothetical protein
MTSNAPFWGGGDKSVTPPLLLRRGATLDFSRALMVFEK